MNHTAGYEKLTVNAKMAVRMKASDYTFACKHGNEEHARRIAESMRTYISALVDMGILVDEDDLDLYEAMTEEGNKAWNERLAKEEKA